MPNNDGELGALSRQFQELIQENRDCRGQFETFKNDYVKNNDDRVAKLEEVSRENKKFGKETRANDNKRDIATIALSCIIKAYPNIYGEKTKTEDGKEIKYLPIEKNEDLYNHVIHDFFAKVLNVDPASCLVQSVRRFPQAPGDLYPAPIRVTFVRSCDKAAVYKKLHLIKEGPSTFSKVRVCPDRPALLNKECEIVDKATEIIRRERPNTTTKYVFVGEKPRIQTKPKNDREATWKMLSAQEQKTWMEKAKKAIEDQKKAGGSNGAKRKASSDAPPGHNVNSDRRRRQNDNGNGWNGQGQGWSTPRGAW